MEQLLSPAQLRAARRQLASAAAAAQGGVLGRVQLLRLGVSRWEITAEVRAGRWHRIGRQAIRVHPGDPQLARWWAALLEVGKPAVLDGVSALVASGLSQVVEEAVHVAVPKSADPRRPGGVTVHETRRFESSSVMGSGIRRMKPATAAVHAALWARTDREAAYLVIASAQQGLFTADELGEEVLKIRRDRRRLLLRSLWHDVAGGVEALGERTFAEMCARRGFPPASRQVRYGTEWGGIRLDVDWLEYATSVEIDGVQHRDVTSWLRDAIKQNAMSVAGRTVLRIPNLALRLDPEPFLDQVEQALRKGGWSGSSPPTSATSDRVRAIAYSASDVPDGWRYRMAGRPTKRAV